LFGDYMALEERRFMGDASFWGILQELLDTDPPLLKLPEGRQLSRPPGSKDQLLRLTRQGEAVLAGGKNWLDQTPIDRWIGGVHLTPNNRWCWSAKAQGLVHTAGASE
jgi:hypothetical protein